jgi:hypothetical protein
LGPGICASRWQHDVKACQGRWTIGSNCQYIRLWLLCFSDGYRHPTVVHAGVVFVSDSVVIGLSSTITLWNNPCTWISWNLTSHDVHQFWHAHSHRIPCTVLNRESLYLEGIRTRRDSAPVRLLMTLVVYESGLCCSCKFVGSFRISSCAASPVMIQCFSLVWS